MAEQESTHLLRPARVSAFVAVGLVLYAVL